MANPEAMERLRATFKAAQDFGLTDDGVWEVVADVARGVPPGRPAAESINEVADALAARINQQRGE
jgi:hypothetical protein